MGEDTDRIPRERTVLDLFTPIAPACELSIPEAHRRPVGVIGAGAIVQVAHLPAYRRYGVPVAAVCDLDPARAEEVRARFDVPAVRTVDELLSDPAIEVVDIAVVPHAQPALAERALRAGKHVLAQKPLAEDSATASRLAGIAAETGRTLVVNHQMRYGEGMAAARAIAEAGWLGEVTTVTFDVDISTDWSAWDWLLNSPKLDLFYHSIHYFDTIRALFGTPERVFCAGSRRPGQAAAGETRTMTTMLWPDGRRALVHVNHENLTGDHHARFRIDGSAGSVRGTVGLLYDYPHGRPDTLEVQSTVLPTDGWMPYPVTTRWIPDAFAGPMRALLSSIAGGPAAPTHAADAVETVRLVEACYAAMATGETQKLG
jgi:predicted dehydrogenase